MPQLSLLLLHPLHWR